MIRYILVFISILTRSLVFSQANIQLEDLEKIAITDQGGGLGGGFKFTYELLKKDGKWICFRKSLKSESWSFTKEQLAWLQRAKAMPEKLIKVIEASEINDFLKTISVLKPQLDWRTFGISPATMKHFADTAKLYARYNRMWTEHVKEYYTEDNIETAIEDYQLSAWTDDGAICLIDIITKQGDTVKVSSIGQHSYMLPWKINGLKTYDINISRFFTEVIDREAVYSNYDRVAGITLPAELNRQIIYKHVKVTPTYFDWKAGNEENLTILKSNFKLGDLKFDGGDAKCSLSHSAFPSNVTLEATIDIKSKKNIESLVHYRDSIIRCIKLNNFVFTAYINKPNSKIEFPKYRYNTPTSYYLADLVQERLPAFKKYDLSKVLFFKALYKTGTTEWLLLPDNKLVLYHHITPLGVNIPDSVLNLQESQMFGMTDDSVFILFDSKGKVLQVSKKL